VQMAGVNRGGSGAGGPGSSTLPPQELLEDLCSRFVLNAPEEELRSFERILFYVEQAHWFYEDYTMEQNQYLKSLTLREFTSLSIL
jgi:mRNA-decapping enzyme subunit 2